MLRPKKKITKKEIERDPILEKTIEIEQFIKHHTKNISIAIGVIVIGILVGLFMMKANKQKTLDASGKLGIAQLSLQRGDIDDGILRLEELIEDFSGTESAGAAHIFIGQTYLEKGDYEMAEKYYSDYVKKYKDSLGKSAAYKALGVCSESKGNFDQAVDYFEKAVKSADYKFQKQIAQISLANASIELKDFSKAKKVLETLENSEPDYNMKNQIELLSAKLAILEK